LISYVLRRQGRFPEALDRLLDYYALNPGSKGQPAEVATTYQATGDYEKADRYLRKAIEADPLASYYADAAGNLILWKGDLAASRAMFARMPKRDPSYDSYWFWQLFLERNRSGALAFLDTAGVPVLIDQMTYWPVSLCRAMAYWSTGGDSSVPRLLEDASRVLEERLRGVPKDSWAHAALALTCALLGKKDEALRRADRAIDLYPIERDAVLGTFLIENRARVLLLLGKPDEAVEELEKLFKCPGRGYCISVPWLRLNPFYDSLRNNPRFQKLLEKYGN